MIKSSRMSGKSPDIIFRVLEIIIEKEVSIVYLKHTKHVAFYNAHFKSYSEKRLTEEEYNLLKGLIIL